VAIDRARRAGDATVMIWNKGENELHPPYRRVEMSVATGKAIALSTEISPDTMRAVFIAVGIQLDPETGDATQDDLLAPEKTFTDPEKWRAAVAELRSSLLASD
jgi:hypothetical protein